MYQSFAPLQELWGTAHRIFDPFSYRAPLCERFVPICIEESFNLCGRYPIVWRRNDVGDFELVAVRSLVADAEIPHIRQIGADALPLLLQAYPFRYKNLAAGELEIGMERVAPTSERNIGAYVYDHLGNFQLGAELKLKALERFRRSLGWEKALTKALTRHNMLETVGMPQDLCEQHRVPEFTAAVQAPDHALLLQEIPKEGRKTVLTFLTAQRLSLFRMASIIGLSETLQVTS
ncbi:SapC family protein [Pseudophaeobacter leonis]|uniref:SapC family protein n=1 Tax=Pseudophaeobacter leonis TaxID=1144477 RepID=UPI0009F19215|nr:SapC family protein [Pseudophaeobacter leonis]